MKTISERLRTAITSQGRTIRDVQRELQDRGVRGSSYASFHGYVRDPNQIPPLELVEVAAEILGVRPAWLAFGEGQPTETEERLTTRATRDSSREREELRGEWEHTRESYGTDPVMTATFAAGVPWFNSLSPAAQVVFREAWARYAGGSPSKDLSVQQLAEIGVDLAHMLILPGTRWGFRHDLEPEAPAFTDYAIAMLHALMLAMPGPGRGQPIEERNQEEG